MSKRIPLVGVLVLYGCAALQFTRFYIKSTIPYLNLTAYLNGRERLPFQQRVFPILFLRPLENASWVRHLQQAQNSAMREQWPAYLLSLVSLVLAALFTQLLYERLSQDGLLRILVFPMFLLAVLWTFAIHLEADFFYPYDLPSLAFFTAGLYFIWTRRFWPLLLVILIGTSNRETTVFLIGIYVLDALSSREFSGSHASRPAASSWLSTPLARVPWLRALFLFAIWLAVRTALAHRFAGNDRSESYLRVEDNLHQLRLRLLPALLNLCGYLLPMVLLFAPRLRPARFRHYLWVLPVWFAVMFGAGVLVETRIYGEWCGYSAIAAVLLLEDSVRLRLRRERPAPEVATLPERRPASARPAA